MSHERLLAVHLGGMEGNGLIPLYKDQHAPYSLDV